ncbi:MAG: ATP-dependent 6-phosphofructokinase, partial [Spirochaetota bacterium]|nr:ATP-dependent 6-phosphofructokinase [Spirochaetota bacterium]
MAETFDTKIETLGTPEIPSPIKNELFTDDQDRILYNVFLNEVKSALIEGQYLMAFERAGAREKIYFSPASSRAAIVSCGGLCPGINNVIRSLVMQLYFTYDVKDILGIRYGYQGLNPEVGLEPIALNPTLVNDISRSGGSILGSSRGGQPLDIMVDFLEQQKINMLFTIGGDGTLRGAAKIAGEINKRGLKISVIGIPKTIDNDISYVAKSFGFETAFSAAVQSIEGAHVEAMGAPNGIGLVKLMGRHSGFIAANAALALKQVNFVMVPEVDFDLEGDNGLLEVLKRRLAVKRHAVIVVAEGAGQKFFQEKNMGSDPSGNVKLGDIGIYLKDKITQHFKSQNIELNLKYIDPSYIIRSVPANPNDTVFCGLLAQNAVHAAMAGKTNMVIAVWNN